ncbi:MAG: FAD-binding oxidoreductase, partial [Burkholderiaceae bacterium]
RALAVGRPKNTQEVAAVLRHCATHATPVVAQGGNTGLAMGSTPDTSGRAVVLSTTRMNRLRALDRANLTMTVDAGCVLQQAQHWAAEADLLLPLSLASEGSCTIGGNMATNAGGTQVLRYGNARDLCLGLEVVTVQGQVWHGLSGLRKDNTGYDLRHLMIGSEGTLGIITAATLKLYPMPAARLTAWARVPSVSAAVSLLGVAQRHLDAALTGFEMMGQQALAITARQLPSLHIPFEGAGPYAVLIEVSDAHGEDQARQALEAVLQEGFEAEHITDAVVAQSLQQAQALWHVRESIPLAQAQEGLNIKHDIALPVSRLAEFVQHTDAALLSAVPGAR